MRKCRFSDSLIIWIKVRLIALKNAKKKIRIGRGCNIGRKTEFEGFNAVGDRTFFSGSIGFGSYIGKKCNLAAKIGRYTCIGPGVETVYGNHPITEFVSMHPAFYSVAQQAGFTYVEENKYKEDMNSVVIGNDVWIGANALILGGVHIGDGSVIAMGAVVTKDVAPYSIVGGVPAKLIRSRFSNEISERLQKIKWWEWNSEKLRLYANDFSNVDQFTAKYIDEEK